MMIAMMPDVLTRKRSPYIVISIAVLITGLPTRLAPQIMPAFMVQYGGDMLWALMIFLMLCVLFPATKTYKLVLLAIAVTWGIEFSELYQAD
jgi:hypothetical protein